jgi:hypothetical protein
VVPREFQPLRLGEQAEKAVDFSWFIKKMVERIRGRDWSSLLIARQRAKQEKLNRAFVTSHLFRTGQ